MIRSYNSFLKLYSPYIATEDKDLSKIYLILMEILNKKKYDLYNEILEKIEVEKIHKVLAIGLLRLSFLHKKELKEWNNFYKKLKKYFKKAGFDSNKLLKGLDN